MKYILLFTLVLITTLTYSQDGIYSGDGDIPQNTVSKLNGDWSIGCTPMLYFDKDKNRIGLGLSNPASTLHLWSPSSTHFLLQSTGNSIITLHNTDNNPNSSINFYTQGGTLSNPIPTQVGQNMGSLNFIGRRGNGAPITSSQILVKAQDDFTGPLGSSINFRTIRKGDYFIKSRLYISEEKGYVGINTEQPQAMLDVNGAITFSREYEVNGSQTDEGELFKGIDGNLYYKSDESTRQVNGGAGGGGVLKLTKAERDTISNLEDGLLVYCKDCISSCNNIKGALTFYQQTSLSWIDPCNLSGVRQEVTGVTVDWTRHKKFGTEANPETELDIIYDIQEQRVEEQWMFHQSSQPPNFPVGSVIRGTYNENAINFIRFEYVSLVRINVIINE